MSLPDIAAFEDFVAAARVVAEQRAAGPCELVHSSTRPFMDRDDA